MLRIRCLAILAGLIVLPTTSHALESAPVTTAHTTATLLTNTDAVQSGQPFEAGLRLVLAPGWHTYWKNPGDAGFPVTIAVSPASKGLVGPLEWPAPQRIAEGDLTTFGYRDNVTFPMKVTPDRAPVTLAIHASWLACHDICVPGEADLSLDIPAGQPIPSPQAPVIAVAVAQTPSPAPFKAVLSKDGMLHLSGSSLPADTVRAEFFPDGDGQTETLGMQPTVDHGGELTIAVALRPSPQADGPATGVLSLVQASGAIKAYTISASPGSASTGYATSAPPAGSGFGRRVVTQPHALCVPSACDEGHGTGTAFWSGSPDHQGGSRQLLGGSDRRLHCPWRLPGGASQCWSRGRMGIPVPIAGLCYGRGLAAVRHWVEHVGGVRGR